MADPSKTDKSGTEPGKVEPEASQDREEPSPLERDLASYPLREPAEDPRWAVRVVWGWLGFALFSLLFTVVLIVLGWFYD